MRKIVVMNSKGGCGKTTIATNLASLYAAHGFKTTLYDHDSQGSSTSWISRRSDDLPEICGISAFESGWAVTRSWQMRCPTGTERIIVDTPAGIKGFDAGVYLKDTDIIVIPVLPSVVDAEASAIFAHNLLKVMKSRSSRAQVVVVANRARSSSPVLKIMEELFSDMDIPIIARLGDAMSYTLCSDLGAGIIDLSEKRAKRERQNMLDFVEAIDEDFIDEDMGIDASPTKFAETSVKNAYQDITLSIHHSEPRRYTISMK